MSKSDTRIKTESARVIAGSVLGVLNQMNMITAGVAAGSIRRGALEVGDVELLVAAKYGSVKDSMRQLGLFKDTKNIKVNLFDAYTPALLNGTHPLKPLRVGGSKYKQFQFDNGVTRVKIDCFICHDNAQWGLLLALRTGSAGFMRVIASHVKNNLPLIVWAEGRLYKKDFVGAKGFNGEFIPTHTETDFFNAIELPTIPPPHRTEAAARQLVQGWEAMNNG